MKWLLKRTCRYHRLSKWIYILTIIYVLFLFTDLIPLWFVLDEVTVFVESVIVIQYVVTVRRNIAGNTVNVMTTAVLTMTTLYVEVSLHWSEWLFTCLIQRQSVKGMIIVYQQMRWCPSFVESGVNHYNSSNEAYSIEHYVSVTFLHP